MYSVIDLFSGAGGLSLGFTQTDKYRIKVAFENSPYMQDTYKRNHPDVDVRGDVCVADYDEIQKKYGSIDVVIGGPPCQGFSNANRQKNHAISQNNKLVKQYMRAILELKPKAFVMENVSMLKSEVHRFYMEQKDLPVVAAYNIPVKILPLHLLDQQFMFDGALEVIQNKDLVAKYLWNESAYSIVNIVYKAGINEKKLQIALKKHKKNLCKIARTIITDAESPHQIEVASNKAFRAILDYYEGKLLASEIRSFIEPAIMIQRMLSKAKEIFDNSIVVETYDSSNGLSAMIKTFAVYDYITRILGSAENGYVISSSVLCAADYGAPQKRMRFVMMGIKKEIATKIALPKGWYDEDEYRTVRDAISDLEEVPPCVALEDDKGISLEAKENLSDLARMLRDSDILWNHIVTNTTETAMARFRVLKPGENFHALANELIENTYTDASRTQNTIYLRLNYDEPSGTVVNVRKSMWIHPVLNRAISVREAARLQTFPDSFVFCGSKDKQYQQVGNAVPPIMAKAIAEKLAKALDEGNQKDVGNG